MGSPGMLGLCRYQRSQRARDSLVNFIKPGLELAEQGGARVTAHAPAGPRLRSPAPVTGPREDFLLSFTA